MGASVVGDKKRRRAERETGLVINRLWRWGNRNWDALVPSGDGHVHYWVDPYTWEATLSDGPCYDTCATPRKGYVAPWAHAAGR